MRSCLISVQVDIHCKPIPLQKPHFGSKQEGVLVNAAGDRFHSLQLSRRNRVLDRLGNPPGLSIVAAKIGKKAETRHYVELYGSVPAVQTGEFQASPRLLGRSQIGIPAEYFDLRRALRRRTGRNKQSKYGDQES